MSMLKLGLSFAGAALLVACATHPSGPTQAQTQGQTGEKFEVPIGYQKVVMNGQDRYCRTDLDTGSHITHSRVCYTMAQLQAEQADTQTGFQNMIQNSQAVGNAAGPGGPTAR